MKFAIRDYSRGKCGELETVSTEPRISVVTDRGIEVMTIELQSDGSITIRGVQAPSGRWDSALVVRPNVSNVINVAVGSA